MAYDYSELVELTKRWADQALAGGWIDQKTAEALSQFDTRTPENLFKTSGSRPLIVAFMGGTGVGKSSLLNRLAGKPIAKAGVERPTSREVTLFHHQDVVVQNLPEKLPVEKIRIAQHDDDSKKNIIWIDMPDFDSTEQSNKLLVFEWLPHIDVLIYVVSPERYRDEKAWKVLLSEGHRYAWLFVLNQWDRGQQAQYEDFNQQLHKAGFIEPIIFKTICAENTAYPDEFTALETTIMSLANKHIVAELEQRGAQVRKDELRKKLLQVETVLGKGQSFKQAEAIWGKQWDATAKQLQQGFVWPMQRLAAFYANRAANLLGQAVPDSSQVANVQDGLWDDWAQARFGDALDEFIVNVDALNLPVTPLKNQLSAMRTKAPKIVQNQTELQARKALANPGGMLHRAFLKFMRFCEFFLPLAAIGAVAYLVSIGYYDSFVNHKGYLGQDFAIHSGLLVLMSWLTPWFILKKMKPSLEKSALYGLEQGLENSIEMIDGEVENILEVVAEEHKHQLQQVNNISEHCRAGSEQSQIKSGDDTPLARMLIR